jgi:hypothetical protein
MLAYKTPKSALEEQGAIDMFYTPVINAFEFIILLLKRTFKGKYNNTLKAKNITHWYVET